MRPPAPQPPESNHVYRWLWRWHGYAGLFVVPFLLYMSLTGLPFVWQRELEDAFHPEYRALSPQSVRASYEQQLSVARAAVPGKTLRRIQVDDNPRHATQFFFDGDGDPTTVAVDPYTGKVVSVIREWQRLSFVAIQLHGLAFIEPYGSWLLELLACWGIVLCITGIFLWWPRGPEWSRWGVFLPRFRSGSRTRLRDLHAVTGFYFAAVLALYLFTGLPWTAFWGAKLLASIQRATGQVYPATMTGDSGLKSIPPAPGASPLPLDAFITFGFQQRLPGHLEMELPAGADGTVHLYNRAGNPIREKHWQLNRFTGQPLGVATWSEIPLIPKAVALGIDGHEGALFGRPTQLLSTTLAIAFVCLSVAAAAMWWKRRPQGRLDFPKIVPTVPLGRTMTAILIGLGILMPMLGLSFWVIHFLSNRAAKPVAPTA